MTAAPSIGLPAVDRQIGRFSSITSFVVGDVNRVSIFPCRDITSSSSPVGVIGPLEDGNEAIFKLPTIFPFLLIFTTRLGVVHAVSTGATELPDSPGLPTDSNCLAGRWRAVFCDAFMHLEGGSKLV